MVEPFGRPPLGETSVDEVLRLRIPSDLRAALSKEVVFAAIVTAFVVVAIIVIDSSVG